MATTDSSAVVDRPEAGAPEVPAEGAETPATEGAAPDAPEAPESPASTTEPDAPSYELELPKESPITAQQQRELIELARMHDVPPAAAQLFLQREHDLAVQMEEQRLGRWADQVVAWEKEVTNDPKVGGQHFEQTKAHMTAALARFWPPEFMGELTESGLVNHPNFVRGLAKLGAAMAEPGGPIGGTPSKARGEAALFKNTPVEYGGSKE
jgi:hypothetical protein